MRRRPALRLIVGRVARAAVAVTLALLVVACGGGGGDDGGSPGGSTLDGFATASLSIDGVAFEVWLADDDAQRRRGFMGATEEQLAPLLDGTPRGMLFRYPEDRLLSFFMRDTGVPLDLAYATADGRIVDVHRLVPFDETPVPASQPVRYAFEARQGTFAAHGIGIGDRIDLP